MAADLFLTALKPILDHLRGLDPNDAAATRASLDKAFPLSSPAVAGIRKLFTQGVAEGWLCQQAAGTARFSRVAKASDATHGYSVDAVQLSGPGVWHRHTRGEIDLCFAHAPGARFDGNPEGWVVLGPGTDHVPEVTGGTMDILYFLPGGALEWKR